MPWPGQKQGKDGRHKKAFAGLRLVGTTSIGVYVLECDCGGTVTSSLGKVLDGRTRDCGCGAGGWKTDGDISATRTRSLDEMEARTAATWLGLIYAGEPMVPAWSGSSESYGTFRNDVGLCVYMSRLVRVDERVAWMSGNVRWEIDRTW